MSKLVTSWLEDPTLKKVALRGFEEAVWNRRGLKKKPLTLVKDCPFIAKITWGIWKATHLSHTRFPDFILVLVASWICPIYTCKIEPFYDQRRIWLKREDFQGWPFRRNLKVWTLKRKLLTWRLYSTLCARARLFLSVRSQKISIEFSINFHLSNERIANVGTIKDSVAPWTIGSLGSKEEQWRFRKCSIYGINFFSYS